MHKAPQVGKSDTSQLRSLYFIMCNSIILCKKWSFEALPKQLRLSGIYAMLITCLKRQAVLNFSFTGSLGCLVAVSTINIMTRGSNRCLFT